MRLASVLSLMTLAGLMGVCAQTGVIGGTVVDDAGNPVPGARVLYYSLPNYGSGAAAALQQAAPRSVSSSTLTGQSGDFQITGLAAGAYYICALPSSAGLLPSCAYGPKPMILYLASGQVIANARVTLPSGAVVLIRVLDPGGNLPQGHRFSAVSMAGDGTYEVGRSISQNSVETDYQLTIPKDRTSRLMIQTDLTATDARGAIIPKLRPTVPLPTAGATGSSPVVVVLAVR